MTAARFLPWLLKRTGPPYTELPQAAAGSWPDKLPDLPLGLYCHIPFCRQLCAFCPYCKTLYDDETARAYLQAMLMEIDLTAERAGLLHKRHPVTDLYFGGGTPALMGEQLKTLIDRLRQYFDIRGGIGIELHPDDLTKATLNTLADAGFSMISIGVQSFDPAILCRLGRPATDLAKKMKLVRSAGFQVIDMDLIFGIKGQTVSSLQQDMRLARELGATQISTYPLIDFSYTESACRPAGARQQRRLLHALAESGCELGLDRTAVWTFARPGSVRYTSVTRPAFYGFGVSAVSVTGPHMYINTFSVRNYCEQLQASQLPQSRCLVFNEQQRALYVLFWQAYRLYLDRDDFRMRTGREMEQCLPGLLRLARIMGWIRRQPEGKGYALTRRGLLLYHEVEQQVTHSLLDPLWRQSRQSE